MTLKEQGMQMVIDSQDRLIKELAVELRRISRKNIKMRMHMQIIAGIPYCGTAEKLREKHNTEVFTETIINLN